MPKLKFLCTCTEPKPCTHERAVNEKGVYLKQIIDYVRKDERNKTIEEVEKMIRSWVLSWERNSEDIILINYLERELIRLKETIRLG